MSGGSRPSPTERRVALLADAARRAAVYLDGQDARGVTPTPEAVQRLAQLRRPFPETGAAPEDVLAELDAVGSPATMVTTNGRYFGFVNGGTDPAAHAASVLAGAWDQNVALPVMSPIGAALDEVAASWVVEALHLPDGAVASFCAGATIANLTCVITARDALLARAGWEVNARGLWGAPRLRVIMGDEVHISALKALRLAGFGLDAMERVPTDALGRVRADAFPTDTDDKTLVILQAGNVNTGYSDPFAEIVPGVRARGGWVHVDGAFGLWAAASPAKRALVEGVARADSWAADCHKWLNTPYDTGVAIARSRTDLQRAMHMTAAYVESVEERQPMQLGIQMSQKARGVETWAMLASHGRAGLAALIDRCCDHAARMASRLAEGGVEILAPVALNQVLVAFGDDATTDAVIGRVQADGTCWVGGTSWHGRRAMRISVSDTATTEQDIERCARAILACVRHM
ncbi:MAG TPA: pyridoxal-dependent decarboxylase [Kofleriaceae bacterium]|nr:pyridoxal-dependent decarboxylase [Kofleriaceae bacterium]